MGRAVSDAIQHKPANIVKRSHFLVLESTPASENCSESHPIYLESVTQNLYQRFCRGFCKTEDQFVSSCRGRLRLACREHGFWSKEKFSLGIPANIPGGDLALLKEDDSARMGLAWRGDLFWRSRAKCSFRMSANMAEGVDDLGFLKERYSRYHFLLLGFTGLALLSGTVSYAEDQNDRLQEQPQAKSNIHTARWRIFTDKARDLCRQGSLDNAENYFHRALEEAKLGFGEEDPHVASCYNNLAELFRMKKEYDKAGPLYLEAVKRLRESSDLEDDSVGFALHNLGGFYLQQRKLEQAQACYEEALNIKGRALGMDHPEYANTMFHLGEVIRMRGDLEDGLALVRDSTRILEQVGLGNTTLAVKRLTRLSELLVFAGQLEEAEIVQRKVLQVIEFSKDFRISHRVSALENLSAILQKQGKLDECVALLERSIEALKDNNGGNNFQMASLLLKLGGVCFQQGRNSFFQKDHVQALALYDKAEDLLCDAVKVAELHVDAKQNFALGDTTDHILLLAHCLTALGDVQLHKLDLLADSKSLWKTCKDAERVLRLAVSRLEEIIVQQGNDSSSELWKLYKNCTCLLDDLNRKISELQAQGPA
ncbi:hypothetical protein L7F22_058359 [Adiantum nelumboides]|nr:hypothetical protein [Adiantum nelumboides]MCO5604197.1 hypothetical protein [Adiantum nelumboides]